ncbi:MAG: hypothetical protein Q4C03_01560 [bacterium]|nr:hypothetical protein [bacterium]
MQINIVKNIVQRTSKNLLNPLFVHKSKVYKDGASQLFSAIVTTGSVLIKDIAERLNEKNVSMKGCQEKVSGWLDRYDFATPSRRKFGIPGVLSCQWILLLRLMQATSLRIRRIWHGGDGSEI